MDEVVALMNEVPDILKKFDKLPVTDDGAVTSHAFNKLLKDLGILQKEKQY